jgi:hypothetical protein
MPRYSRLWLLMLCLACFQLGVVAPQLAEAMAAGRPFSTALGVTAAWACMGGLALAAVIRLLRLPVPVAPAANEALQATSSTSDRHTTLPRRDAIVPYSVLQARG